MIPWLNLDLAYSRCHAFLRIQDRSKKLFVEWWYNILNVMGSKTLNVIFFPERDEINLKYQWNKNVNKRKLIFLCAITHQFIEEYLWVFFGTKNILPLSWIWNYFVDFSPLSNLLVHHIITTNMKLVLLWHERIYVYYIFLQRRNEIVYIFTRQIQCSRVGYSLLFKVFLSMFPNLLFELSYATYLCICNHKCRVVTI